MAAICAHTNLDAAQGGVNDCLARVLELGDPEQLHQDGTLPDGAPYGIGRVGTAHRPGQTAGQYAAYVKSRLGGRLGAVHRRRKARVRVAVGGGSCGSMLEDARKAGCDTFVTADVKYDTFLLARSLGINLMDAGHFATETVICAEDRPVSDQSVPRRDSTGVPPAQRGLRLRVRRKKQAGKSSTLLVY